jgi:competence ComEA-like helix-hairpin-helix protein
MHLLKTMFFAVDNLHIQLSERYFILSLMTLFIITGLIGPFLKAESPYDEEYYKPLLESFYEHSAENYLERRAVLERYYPGDENLIESYARNILPISFKKEILEKASEIESQKAVTANLKPKPELIDGIELHRNQAIQIADSSRIRININTADVSELSKLPGIGKSIAERIIQFRKENGPFKEIEDIMKVRGIGAGRFNSFRHLLEV